MHNLEYTELYTKDAKEDILKTHGSYVRSLRGNIIMDILMILLLEFLAKMFQISISEGTKKFINAINFLIWLTRIVLSIIFVGGDSDVRKLYKEDHTNCKNSAPTSSSGLIKCAMAKTYMQAWDCEVAYLVIYIVFGLIAPIIAYFY